MNRGLMGNADLSYGTKDRYAERLMGAYFNSDIRAMLFGNANNTNDMGFPEVAEEARSDADATD